MHNRTNNDFYYLGNEIKCTSLFIRVKKKYKVPIHKTEMRNEK